jgi:hypothetical protein
LEAVSIVPQNKKTSDEKQHGETLETAHKG